MVQKMLEDIFFYLWVIKLYDDYSTASVLYKKQMITVKFSK